MAGTETLTRAHMKPLIEPYGLVEAVRAGTTLYIAGQTGIGTDHQVVAGGLKAQALQAFQNIREIVELAGGDASSLVHLTWYLAEPAVPTTFLEDAMAVTTAREEVFPGLKTGSTAVRVKALLTPEILIEIQAIAEL